jgi:ParB family chromosome partitioning protein
MDDFGLTQEEVAERVGKSRTSVANTVRLLKLTNGVKEALASERISEGHARALLGLSTASLQRQALSVIEARGLNVRQTEALVRQMQAEPEEPAPKAELSPQDQDAVERFQQRLGTKVNLVRAKKGGRVVIHFYSEEELQAIYEAIVGD